MFKVLVEPRFVGLALGLALLLGCFPAAAQAGMVGSLAASDQPLTPRQAREAQALRLLSEARVAEALESHGLDARQIRTRLDRLDDQQLEQLTQNLETVQSGKGGAYLLVGIAVLLLFVLIYMQIEAA